MEEKEEMLRSPGVPRLDDLIREYQSCSPRSDGYDRGLDSERIRFARWENQSWDCKKHSSGNFAAKPWDGASDARVFVSDEIVQDEVAILLGAFDRVAIQAEAMGADDLETTGAAQRMLRWMMKGRCVREMRRAVELSAQYFCTYGWAVLNPVWEREIGLRNQTFTFDQVARIIGPEKSKVLNDPAYETEAAAILLELRQLYVEQQMAGVISGDEIPQLSKSKATQYLRQLRDEGSVTLPMPYVCRNQPRIRALRPWHEIKIPEQMGDLQRGMAFVTEFMTVDQLHAYARGEGWDEQWLKLAEAAKGKRSIWTEANTVSAKGVRIDQSQGTGEFVEVVTAYTWRLDEDGIPGIYVTVFSPFVKGQAAEEELVAKHGLIDYQHGRMPLVEGAREWWCSDLTASRGIPEQAYPGQRLMKVMEDALVDRTSITTLPPRLVPAEMMDMEDVFGPASRVPTRPGRDPRFMDIPPNDGTAQLIWSQAEARLARQLGRPHETVPPMISQVRMQKLVTEFLTMWTEALQQTWGLCVQYISPSEWMKILGTPKPEVSPDAIALESDTMLVLDVRELDSEFALKQIDAISKSVLPEDAAGVIDRSRLMQVKLAAIHPGLARRLVQGKAGATQKLYEQVSAEFASMFLGNPARLVENDPTAPIQIQFAQQIVQANPRYQQAMQADQLFKANVEKWLQNRQQSVAQERNKTVGRLGVDPGNGGAR